MLQIDRVCAHEQLDTTTQRGVREHVGHHPCRVRQRLRERSLFGIEYEGSWRLPRFQFERRLVLPGLAQVLKALPTDLFPLDVVDWFVLPDSDLQLDSDPAPLSPREWLVSGRPVETVVALARDLTRA